jgi:cytidine deaminase
LSGSDRDRPDDGSWPEVERRVTPDRRTAHRGGQPEDLELRTPIGMRRLERRSGRDRRDESAWTPVPLELTLAEDLDRDQMLVAAATQARLRAHARYSGFKVGAALETADGFIVSGCNIENASYGLTICAERVAVFKAVSEGRRAFDAIAVAVDSPKLAAPCGPCRQILWEFCGDVWVHMTNLRGKTLTVRMSELLPYPFDRRNL